MKAPSVTATARTRCMLCGGSQFSDLIVPGQCTMRRCQGCGFWVNSGYEPDEGWSAHYGTEYQDSLYGRASRRKLRSARFITRRMEGLRPPGRMLDIGSSLGYVVAAARERGWDAYGVDISADAVARCQAEGLNCAQGDMQHLPYPDGFFDLVHARHVLEHDLEVYASLAEMRRVLAEDGLLVVEVPDAETPKVIRGGAKYAKFWWPEHHVCFTADTLAEFMRRAGFVRVRWTAMAGLTCGGGGTPAFLVWETLHVLKMKLGLATYTQGAWRKTGEVNWTGQQAG